MWKLALHSTLFQYELPRIDLEGDGYDHDAAEADYNAGYEERKRTWEREKNERKKEKIQKDGNNDLDDEADSYDDGDEFADPYQDKYVLFPDPEAYTCRERKASEEEVAKFEQMLVEKRLQVIVKLANIHLSPEKPSYDGGSWHIDVSYVRRSSHSPSTDRYLVGHAQ
jgi:hypothetical protein